MYFRLLLIYCSIFFFSQKTFAQCGVFVDTSSISHITCAGNSDGSANLLSSSTFLYYSWSNITNGQNYGNGVNVTSVNNLDEGFYVVTGTIPFGLCPSPMYSDTFEILDNSSLNITVNLKDTIQCFGDLATINVVTNGGAGWYLYQLNYFTLGNWFPFSQQTTYDTAVFTMLPANTYQIIVSDSMSGCNVQTSIMISQPVAIGSALSPSLQAVCKNNNPDTLMVTTSGVASAYQYEWWTYHPGTQSNQAVVIPNQTDSFLIPSTANVGEAYFYCVVSSGVGCTDTTTIITVETVASPLITIQPQDSAICINALLNISIEDTFFVNVATNTITPIYQWYENAICDTSASGGTVTATGPGNNTRVYTPQTSSPGTTYYYCIVTIPQLIGCSADTSVCAEIIVNPVPTAILSAIPSPACIGDDITLTATPSIPSNLYRFQYNNGGGWTNMTNPQMGNTNPIIYSNINTTTQFRARVREALGCNTSSWQPNNQGITVPISNVVTQPINHY
ncbi:MAG: hypothetical protein VYD71_03640 [Bacteroidota bacterium]|nr:hypothetical protein [Bacteroidota bacterium]